MTETISLARRIVYEVAQKHGFLASALLDTAPCHDRKLSAARHEAWYRLWAEADHSYGMLARQNKRNVETIRHGLTRHRTLLARAGTTPLVGYHRTPVASNAQ